MVCYTDDSAGADAMDDSLSQGADTGPISEYLGTYRNGIIRLDGPVSWNDGTRVVVRVAEPQKVDPAELGPVIIAGFGLPGRWVADIFDRHGIEYVIVDENTQTIVAQKALGRRAIVGDVSREETLREAGIERASILALTVPDERVVLEATRLARRLKPDIYIVARTTYTSSGMQATELGANEVVKAEQTVARQFYEMLLRKVSSGPVRVCSGIAPGQNGALPAGEDHQGRKEHSVG
jgi:voltage-gated potassium channel Kch